MLISKKVSMEPILQSDILGKKTFSHSLGLVWNRTVLHENIKKMNILILNVTQKNYDEESVPDPE
jgi:hypothetical protein